MQPRFLRTECSGAEIPPEPRPLMHIFHRTLPHYALALSQSCGRCLPRSAALLSTAFTSSLSALRSLIPTSTDFKARDPRFPSAPLPCAYQRVLTPRTAGPDRHPLPRARLGAAAAISKSRSSRVAPPPAAAILALPSSRRAGASQAPPTASAPAPAPAQQRLSASGARCPPGHRLPSGHRPSVTSLSRVSPGPPRCGVTQTSAPPAGSFPRRLPPLPSRGGASRWGGASR